MGRHGGDPGGRAARDQLDRPGLVERAWGRLLGRRWRAQTQRMEDEAERWALPLREGGQIVESAMNRTLRERGLVLLRTLRRRVIR